VRAGGFKQRPAERIEVSSPSSPKYRAFKEATWSVRRHSTVTEDTGLWIVIRMLVF
jgi:hypothetical protein